MNDETKSDQRDPEILNAIQKTVQEMFPSQHPNVDDLKSNILIMLSRILDSLQVDDHETAFQQVNSLYQAIDC